MLQIPVAKLRMKYALRVSSFLAMLSPSLVARWTKCYKRYGTSTRKKECRSTCTDNILAYACLLTGTVQRLSTKRIILYTYNKLQFISL